MLKIQEIRELIELIDQSSIDEFKLEQDGSKVTVKKNVGSPVSERAVRTGEAPAESSAKQETKTPAVQEVREAEPVKEEAKEEKPVLEDGLHTIASPMVGTFYEAPSPDSDPYIKKGDKVKPDSIVCIVEAMKLMNEIEAEINGEIVDILVENGQLVEYGQELFVVKPE